MLKFAGDDSTKFKSTVLNPPDTSQQSCASSIRTMALFNGHIEGK